MINLKALKECKPQAGHHLEFCQQSYFMPKLPLFWCCFRYRISTSEKGYMDIKMSVTAPVGHSSVPPSETSIGILAHAIAR